MVNDEFIIQHSWSKLLQCPPNPCVYNGERHDIRWLHPYLLGLEIPLLTDEINS